MNKPYKVCPNCYAHLDPGEKCDCAKELQLKMRKLESVIKKDLTGQYSFNFENETR